MAVAYDASSESHTGTTGSSSEASFTWTHTPVGTPKGVLVFVMQDNASTDKVTSVTYGGTTVPAVSGGFAADTAGEIRACKTFFLGSGIGTGAKSVVVNRTNDATVLYAVAYTVTASANTQVYTPGIVLQQADTALSEQSVDDGSPGSNSLRFAGGSFALNGPPNAGASSGNGVSIDFGSTVAKAVAESTAGQGSRPVGFSNATVDDVAAVYLAIREAVTIITIPVVPGALILETTAGLYDDIYDDIYTDGGAGGIAVTVALQVTPGAVTLTGSSPAVTSKRTFTKGKVTLTGQVVVFGGTIINNIIVVVPGQMFFGGSPRWNDGDALWDDTATVWNGQTAVLLTTTILVTPGAITLTGQVVGASRSFVVIAGVMTLTGQDVQAFAEGGSVFIAPDPGVLTLTGSSIALPAGIPVTAGGLTLAGKAIALSYKVQVGVVGSIAFAGRSVHVSPNEDDQGEDEDEDVPNISHAGGERIGAPDLPGLHRLREHVGLER